ncbi:MAG TPA: signal recognition particle-docking protein FtsY, partial [Rhodobacteraceae bacterium]|nr:signal recognition particle-docking protein FtsY [Paracoccaceae bacterium]
MSFFSKLKKRLTRSSDKIDDGVQALLANEAPVEAPKPGLIARALGADGPKRVLDDAMLESLE